MWPLPGYKVKRPTVSPPRAIVFTTRMTFDQLIRAPREGCSLLRDAEMKGSD